MRERLAWWQTLLATIVGLGIAWIGASLVGGMLALALHASRGGDPTALLDRATMEAELMSLPVLGTTLVITAIGFSGAALLTPKLAGLPVKRTLGLTPAHPGVFLATSVGVVALGPTSDVVARVCKALIPGLSLGSLELLEAALRAGPFLLLFPFIAILPGVGEELFFRGLIQRTFARPALAITVSAISFSLVHLDPHHVIPILPLAFFLAWVAQRSGSTWVTIVAHITNNGLALAAVHLVAENEPEAPLWQSILTMVVGWVVTALCVYAIVRLAPQRASTPNSADAPAPHDGLTTFE